MQLRRKCYCCCEAKQADEFIRDASGNRRNLCRDCVDESEFTRGQRQKHAERKPPSCDTELASRLLMHWARGVAICGH